MENTVIYESDNNYVLRVPLVDHVEWLVVKNHDIKWCMASGIIEFLENENNSASWETLENYFMEEN